MTNYRGRFAPTPSGSLHFGSLFAAVVSYLEAKQHQGKWLVRIDDIDPPREQPGASDDILRTLEAHGLFCDESVVYQSQQSALYEYRLEQLFQQNCLFWCNCSRKDLAGQPVYPGTCRKYHHPREHCAIRVSINSEHDQYFDQFQGNQLSNPKRDCGDVILKRRDQHYAYQLAVAADDIEARISHVIRGIDLMPSTWWQRALYQLWQVPLPVYGHFAVIHPVNSDQKLSKQNLARTLNNNQAEQNLHKVLQLLAIPVERDSCCRMLSQAITMYQPNQLAKKQILTLENMD
ncbi:tRNA glutamyl-Q(34) synthetase GluQRS [Reinekea sp.]|uniref:tRNA glutamyl-Q(34) synthetase GluQRS n=2 Tax=Reinekea sp. TaxID=1970455 RepID=UPI003988CA51